MIKSSGYRISPNEVEEVLYDTQLVGECAAFGVPHATLGEAVIVVVTAREGSAVDVAPLQALCRERQPLRSTCVKGLCLAMPTERSIASRSLPTIDTFAECVES